MTNAGRPFSKEEDEAILAADQFARGVNQALADRFGRTKAVIIQRRFQLKHKEQCVSVNEKWTKEEVALLKKHWPTIEDTADIKRFLPKRTMNQIRSKASTLKVKRLLWSHTKVRFEGHLELVDQIRERSKEDGIPLYRLDAELGSGRYFQFNFKHRVKSKQLTINLHHVVKAVEFFGGKLVIDWQDRTEANQEERALVLTQQGNAR